MDLLACSACKRRFYVAGLNSPPNLLCSHCGEGLTVAHDHITVIPLDARWLDRPQIAEPPKLTVVDLRHKRARGGKASRRIIRDLRDYFDVQTRGHSIRVGVNRGEPESAALRVAAVLDGVDRSWEEHFYLPTTDRVRPSPRPRRVSAPVGQLRLVGSQANPPDQGPA